MMKKCKAFIPVFIAVILFFLGYSCSANEFSDSEKLDLFTIRNITNNIDYEIQDARKYESFSKIAFLNFFEHYEYTFDSTKNREGGPYLYIKSILQKFTTVFEAKKEALIQNNVYTITFKIIGGKKMSLKRDNSFFTLGDDNYHSYIMYNGSVVGNIVTTRVGRRVLIFTVGGLVFDRNLLEKCAGETIKNLRAVSN
jgi:hypothetical protein